MNVWFTFVRGWSRSTTVSSTRYLYASSVILELDSDDKRLIVLLSPDEEFSVSTLHPGR